MKRNILVIDDEQVICDLLVEHLQESGYGAKAVPSVTDALILAGAETFDVILLDLSLGESKGLASLELLRAALPEAVIMVLTGMPPNPKLEREVLDRGATEFLSKMKPFENVTLRLDRFFRQTA
jgi:DNA-binding response OmpR family regulator